MSSGIIIKLIHIIALDLSSTRAHKRVYAQAYIKILSKLPLYLKPGSLFSNDETEAKYLDIMSDFENLVMLYISDKARAENSMNVLINYLANLEINDRKRKKPFSSIYNTYLGTQIKDNTYPLHAMYCMHDVINSIIKHGSRDEMIISFDKFMKNLMIVGISGLRSAYPGCKKITPRIQDTDKYYIESIGNPNFDITRFLLHGPYTMFFYYRAQNEFNIICQILKRPSNIPINISEYYWKHMCATYGWSNLSMDDQEKNFKIIFPDGASLIDALCIPF